MVSIAKSPYAIQESQQLALTLISTITKQLTVKGELSTYEGREEKAVEDQLNEFEQFRKEFDEKPKKFIDGAYNPEKLARLIFTTPDISCESIGDFFGNKSQFCVDTLEKYLELFDFANMDFDDSIRRFLIV